MRDYEDDRRHWIVFDNVQNLRVKGGGIINGNGRMWWRNSCKINKSKVIINLIEINLQNPHFSL